jgi:hypothetical protein
MFVTSMAWAGGDAPAANGEVQSAPRIEWIAVEADTRGKMLASVQCHLLNETPARLFFYAYEEGGREIPSTHSQIYEDGRWRVDIGIGCAVGHKSAFVEPGAELNFTTLVGFRPGDAPIRVGLVLYYERPEAPKAPGPSHPQVTVVTEPVPNPRK